ncbi:MAG: class I SAM-dependent methyltransferase, partial [Chlamydiia bacterium]|nr:class I SAM-dependent methyltransferase [Chlamydiia bacterium]
MLHAVSLLKQRGAKVLVETGTARDGRKNFDGDGGSTIIFGEWAKHHQALLYSVDIDPTAVKIAKSVTKKFGPSVHVICSNSITFLENFQGPIDFLYLDSYDFDANEPLPSQEHHLKEIIAAYPKLHKDSIVMIDDCGLPHGGKGVLVID